MTNLTILNTSIRKFGNLYSLNDLHIVSGNDPKHRPTYFIRNEQTQDLIAELKAENPTCENSHSSILMAKNGVGTYACEELALAYATWISPKFHLVVLRAFIAMHKGETLQKNHEIRPLVEPNNEEEILALLTNNFYFCSLANEMIKKLKQAGLQDKIDLTLGGHYIYNLDHPLEQHLAKIKGYIQAKQERIMYIKGMLNLLDLEPPQTKRLPHTTF